MMNRILKLPLIQAVPVILMLILGFCLGLSFAIGVIG